MLLITCPWCGQRDELEFSYGGEAHLVRPEPTDHATAKEWAEYLFMRTNPKGFHKERWQHTGGCRAWFNAIRDTRTNRLIDVYVVGAPPPEITE